ncbi:MAG: hypothetical protein JSW43_05220 [Gemmatimonadota bacterium]|nr:MAG: hypothetical protein JSW43_05220 [Gemmatimonadota bacterium]
MSRVDWPSEPRGVPHDNRPYTTTDDRMGDTKMPAPDFDFTFRPDSYWDPADPVTAIVANIVGEVRRQCVRDYLAGDPEMRAALANDPDVLMDFLPEPRRDRVGCYHPALMGGEYLPPYLPGETEIARIVLETATLDVYAIRARRSAGRIRYRVVDEYETAFTCAPDSSDLPLTLGELIRLVDSLTGGEDPDACGGRTYLEALLESNARHGNIAGLRRFIAVRSPFYPELEAFYERRATEWCERKRLERLESCDDCGATYDPDQADHDCRERQARERRETGRHDAR